MKVKIKLKREKRKKEMKQFLLSFGIKSGISLVLSAALKGVVEESDSTAVKVVYSVMCVGAYFAGCVVTDKILNKLYEEEW